MRRRKKYLYEYNGQLVSRQTLLHKRRLEQGLCRDCGERPISEGSSRCEVCRIGHREAQARLRSEAKRRRRRRTRRILRRIITSKGWLLAFDTLLGGMLFAGT